jgi:hypothetical protein
MYKSCGCLYASLTTRTWKTHGRVQETEHTEDHKDMKTHGGLQEIEHTEDHKILKTHGRLEV